MATQTGSIDLTASNSVKLAAEAGWQSDLEDYYTKSEIDVTVNGINSTVSTKVGEDEVISSINQSAETVKIQASRVEIDGTAVFNNSAFQEQLTSSYSKTIEYTYSNAGQGTGYAKLANITAKAAYLNLPITFTLYRRGQVAAAHVTVAFANGIPTDTLSQAYYDGWLPLYYVRVDTGSYDIYIALGESWDTVKVANFVNPYTSSDMEVTWAGAYYGTSLPSGAVAFTRLIGQESKASYDNAIASAEANAKAYADTTKIGGRNLMPWSALSGTYVSAYDKASNGYAIVIPTSTSVVIKASGDIFDRISSGLLFIGSQATLSFTAVATGSTNLRCDFFPDTYTGAFGNVVSPVTTTPKRYTITGKIENDSSPTSLRVRFWRLTSDANYAITIWDIKLESGTHATDWSPAPEDLVTRTQRIWYRSNSATAPAAPTSWVTKGDDGSALWTKMHVAITSTHKYIYTCEQYEMADGTLGHTDVLLDNTITVIDGGNIITGSVTANKLNASDINASKSLTVGAMTDAAAAAILNSNVQVGGRNLLFLTRDFKAKSDSTTGGYLSAVLLETRIPIVSETYKGLAVRHFITSNIATSSYYDLCYSSLLIPISGNSYVFSFYAKGSGKVRTHFYPNNSGGTYKNAGSQGQSNTATDGAVDFTVSSDWQRFWVRFEIGGTQGTNARHAILRTFGGNDIFVCGLKFEEGTNPTDWTPAPEDQTAYANEVSAQSAQPNLTPFFEVAPTDTTYWFATGNLSSYTTRLENGWSHVELSNLNLNVSPRVGVLDLSESTTYTVMLEVRNAATLTNCRLSLYTATNSTWSASKNIVVAANGTYYITGVTKADLSSTDITHLRVFFGSDTSTANADIRLSLYEGEYSGPYKPYNGGQLYAHKSDVAWTGTCDTAAGTAAKEVVCDGFTASELTMGATICVRFNAANTSSGALTLNVNGTGAKSISVATGAASATNQLLWASGATIRFMYNTSLGQWRVADTTPTYYSTCSVGEGVAAKTAGCAGCVIFKGVAIHIIMTAANTNTSATLNVNSTGAKAIYYGNTTTRPTTANEYGWKAGATASFVFDGAYWRYADASAMYQSADAAKTASNYITTIDTTNGIKIANASPSSATTYLQLASTFLDFIRGGTSMLKAWLDGSVAKVRVGAEQIDGTDTFNTLTDNEGIKLRRGTTVLSQFATNLIELGKNSYNATISLLNNGIEIYATDIDPDHRVHFGKITSGDSYLQFAPWSTVEGDESAYSASAKFGVKHEFTSTRGFGVDDSVNIGGDGFVGLTTALVDSDDVPLAEAGMYAATNMGAGNSEIAIIGDKVFLYDGGGNTSTYYGPFPMSDVASAIPVTLYDNASASASAATTLSESAANFKRLTIFFKDTDGNYSSTEVWSPNGKRVALSLTWINGASTQNMYQRVRWVTISGTTISTYKGSGDSKYRTGQVKLGATASVANSDYISIVHVIGYR